MMAGSYDTDILDVMIPEPGAIDVMDRGFLDLVRLYRLNTAGACFVLRAKDNFRFRRIASRPVDRTSGIICDQVVALTHQAEREALSRQAPPHLLPRSDHP
jgi:hypothetical protein